MSDYEKNIQDRLDSEVNSRQRAENATMLAIGAIADRLDELVKLLEKMKGGE